MFEQLIEPVWIKLKANKTNFCNSLYQFHEFQVSARTDSISGFKCPIQERKISFGSVSSIQVCNGFRHEVSTDHFVLHRLLPKGNPQTTLLLTLSSSLFCFQTLFFITQCLLKRACPRILLNQIMSQIQSNYESIGVASQCNFVLKNSKTHEKLC